MLRRVDVIRLSGLALLALGLLAVHSAGLDVLSRAGSGQAVGGETSRWLGMFASKHTGLASASAVVLLAASRVDAGAWLSRRGWGNPVTYLLPLAVGLCALVLLPGFGVEVNGAKRWLAIPGLGLNFQPSEVMKWTLIAAVAAWCGKRADRMHRFGGGLLPAGLLIAVGCGLIIKEDLGTAALLGGVAVAVLVAGGARLTHLAPFVLGGLAAAAAAVMTSEYRLRRLTAFLDPWADPAGSGYHPIQSMLSFAQGGVTGVGLGQSVQKYHVPEETTDFILPVISEELGFAGVALIVGLYLVLLWSGLGVMRRRRDAVGRLLALGIVLMIAVQASVNVAVVTVVVPTKGIALPLVSAGGTGWLLTAAAVGVLAGMARREAESADEIEPTGGGAPIPGRSPLGEPSRR